MGVRGFEELRVYQTAEQLADAIWDVVAKWESFAKDSVGKQIVRSADSVGANIAEGFGRGTYNDNKRFVRISRGSLYETRHWLHRANRRRLIEPPQYSALLTQLDTLAHDINRYINYLRNRRQQT